MFWSAVFTPGSWQKIEAIAATSAGDPKCCRLSASELTGRHEQTMSAGTVIYCDILWYTVMHAGCALKMLTYANTFKPWMWCQWCLVIVCSRPELCCSLDPGDRICSSSQDRSGYTITKKNIFPPNPGFARTRTTHPNNMIYLSPKDEWKHWLYAVILTLSFQDLGF